MATLFSPSWRSLWQRFRAGLILRPRFIQFPHYAVALNWRGERMFLPPQMAEMTADIALTGWWERPVEQLTQSLLRRGQVAVELGAQLGYHSLAIADALGPFGRLHAFEADPDAMALLRQTIAANQLQRQVLLYPLLASNRPGSINLPPLYPTPPYPTPARPAADQAAAPAAGTPADAPHAPPAFPPRRPFRHGLDGSGGAQQVETKPTPRPARASPTADEAQPMPRIIPARRLDDVLSDLPEIHFLKMDLGGAEGLALQGAADLVARSPRLTILSRWNPQRLRLRSNVTEIAAWLASRGFHAQRLDQGKLYPVAMEALPECTATALVLNRGPL